MLASTKRKHGQVSTARQTNHSYTCRIRLITEMKSSLRAGDAGCRGAEGSYTGTIALNNNNGVGHVLRGASNALLIYNTSDFNLHRPSS